jgi:hypothetical protein
MGLFLLTYMKLTSVFGKGKIRVKTPEPWAQG